MSTDDLKRLRDLHEQGILSDEEFESEKLRLGKAPAVRAARRPPNPLAPVLTTLVFAPLLAVALTLLSGAWEYEHSGAFGGLVASGLLAVAVVVGSYLYLMRTWLVARRRAMQPVEEEDEFSGGRTSNPSSTTILLAALVLVSALFAWLTLGQDDGNAEAVRAQAEREARELEACEAFASALEQASKSQDLAGLRDSDRELAQRIAYGDLTSGDLVLRQQDMPCVYVLPESDRRIWTGFVAAASQAEGAWSSLSQAPSGDLSAALEAGGGLGEASKRALTVRAETAAKDCAGTAPANDEALVACGLGCEVAADLVGAKSVACSSLSKRIAKARQRQETERRADLLARAESAMACIGPCADGTEESLERCALECSKRHGVRQDGWTEVVKELSEGRMTNERAAKGVLAIAAGRACMAAGY